MTAAVAGGCAAAVVATHRGTGARMYVQASGEADWTLSPSHFYPFTNRESAARFADLFNRKPRVFGIGAQDFRFDVAIL